MSTLIEPSILDILERCAITGNVVTLPPGQLERKTYEAVNKCLAGIGGKWNRKAAGHVFSDDPSELFQAVLVNGRVINLKQDLQFFETPKPVALQMIELAQLGHENVLEPSAGIGALATVIPGDRCVYAIEKDPRLCSRLRSRGFLSARCADFLAYEGTWDGATHTRIVMNPPFSNQQDITHILHAFDILEVGGIVVSVCSESPFFRTNGRSVAFRKFLDEQDATIIRLEPNAFKSSGTSIATRLIKLRKSGSREISA